MPRQALFLMTFAALCIGYMTAPACAADDPAPANWPTWRGPQETGLALDAKPPTTWSETENLSWKVELPGPGHATPVIWGDRIFVLSAVSASSTKEEKASTTRQPEALLASNTQLAQQPPPPPGRPPRRGNGPPRSEKPTDLHRFTVTALSRKDGSTLWQTVVREEVPHEGGHLTASQASASPVTDGKHVWAHFGSRGLYCLDAATGKIEWEADLGEMRTRNEFGEGASPVVHDDLIVVVWDHEGKSFIVALDKLTGKERWRTARDEPTSWATPLVIEDDGKPLVLASGTNQVRAYDLKTGKVVWSASGLGLNCVPTPVTDGETAWVMSGYREAAGMAIRYVGAKGDITDSDRIKWKIDQGLSYVPSPLLYDSTLYFLERFKGMLSSYDLKTGKERYTKQRLEGIGNTYASLVGAAGNVYVLDRDGNALVFKHGKKFEEVARSKLDDAFDASPVIVGDELYLRGHRFLYKVADK
jgi:outer membrane protein assembly factor BamB